MKHRDLFRLGFVRPFGGEKPPPNLVNRRSPARATRGDYVVERLGVSYRSAQEWMRTDEALERLPLAAAAFEAGGITSGHVRLLTRVARPETEAYWVGLAGRVGVRAFASAVAAGEKAEAEGSAGDGASASAEPDSGGSPAAPDEGSELVPLEIAAPAWLAASWREIMAFIRRLAGAALPAGECLEHVLAEFGGAAGEAPGGEDGADLPSSAFPSGGETEGAGRMEDADLPSSASSSEQAAGAGTLDGADLSPPASPGSRAALGDLPLSAREIDRELRELMAARQSREWNLAESLRGVAMTWSYRVHGFRRWRNTRKTGSASHRGRSTVSSPSRRRWTGYPSCAGRSWLGG